MNGVLRQNGGVFLRRKRTSLHARVQLVAPTQPARLARPSRQSFRDRRPVTWSAESFDLSTQQIILLRRRGENKTSRKQIVSQSQRSLFSLKNKQTNKSHNSSYSQGPNRQRNDKSARVVGVQRPGCGRRRRRRPSPPTPTFNTARRDAETMTRILFSRVPVSIHASPFVYPSSSSRMSRATSPRARVPVPLGSLRQRCVVSPSRPAVVRARAFDCVRLRE